MTPSARRRTALAFLVGALSVLLAPIASAQSITINEARNQGVGATVTVEGTVTRAYGDFVRLQDDSGPTGASGLNVRKTSGGFYEDVQDGTITQGTQLQVTGTLSEFQGLLQINEGDLSGYTVQGQGTVPAPQAVTLSQLRSNGENYESELVEVTGLNFLGGSASFQNYTSYPVSDGSGSTTFESGTLTFRVQSPDETALGGEARPKGVFSFTGVVGEFSGRHQLIPIRPADVEPVRSFGFTKQFAQAQEGSGTVEVDVRAFAAESGDNVSVTARVAEPSTATNGSDVTTFSSPQTLTFSGSDPAPQTLSFDVANDTEEEGVERLEVVLESSDGAIARPSRFTLWVLDDATAQATLEEGTSGDALIDALQATYGEPKTLGYDIARDSLFRRIYNEGGTVEGIYSGAQATITAGGDASTQAANQSINTEHLWPRSTGAGSEPALSNLHILAPSRQQVNSARSNYAFGEIPDADTDQWFFEDQSQSTAPPESDRPAWAELNNSPSTRDDRRLEPRHSVKGDVARAVFYFVTMYPTRADLAFYEAQRETLLNWHEQDPVDATEMRRNLTQASYQGNKLNPFVVDPTLVDRAYGSGGGTPGGDVISIDEARSRGAGSNVAVEGTVTRAYGSYIRLQDDSGPTGASGLMIRQTNGGLSSEIQQAIADGTITQGTRLRLAGTISAYNGLLQINNDDLNRYTVQGQGSLPAAQTVTLSDLSGAGGEDYESELLRVENLSFPSASGTFAGGTTYTVQDGGGTQFEFRVQDNEETDLIGVSVPTGTFTYEGVLGQYNGAGFDADEPDDGYQLIPVRPETALPVELASFDAVRSDAAVELSWRTVSETNNARFEVQRRADGAAWTTLGSVKGAGTTTQPQSYRFEDAALPFAADRLTYRLKQVDTDGGTHLSDPVTVQRTVESVTLRQPFPNPARQDVSVRFAVPEAADARAQTATLRVYDVLGRQVMTVAEQPGAGRTEVQVDVSSLSSGVYFLRLSAGGEVRTKRLTVVR